MSNLLQKQIKLIDSHSFSLSEIKPSDFAEAKRVMSSEVSAWEGQFSYDRTPYLKEIVNRLATDDPARVVSVIKGAQIGFTAGCIENGIVWIISQAPGPILFMCGDKELTKEVVDIRLEQAIDSCGIRHLIRPNAVKKKNQKTGDTSMFKEFAGGSLVADGVNNPGKLRNRSMMYGFIDDYDHAKMDDKKEGSFKRRLEMRFASYAWKMKLFYISTPTIKGQSNIEATYLLGDQRKYNVPCPCCGEYIVIEWRVKLAENQFAGIHFELDEHGKLKEKSVGYICQKCGQFFTEKHKRDMLLNGMWIPTAESSEDGYFSYQIPSLYAPPGMYNWAYYVRQFLECYPNGLANKANVGNLKTFLNTCLGQTYEERGKAPKIMQLAQNTRNYKIGEVPCLLSEKDGNGKIVMLTCACDLNGFPDDARLDYEVVAHAESGTTYSIDVGSIGTFQRGQSQEGREPFTYRNNDPMSVWNIFLRDVLQKKYKSDDNRYFIIHAAGVDTGNFTNFANVFIEQCQNEAIPLMVCGVKGDIRTRKIGADTSPYKYSKEREFLYLLEVNQLKDELADKMELIWNEGSGLTQPVGFMNYPEPADGKYTLKNYFTHFESEHKIAELNADGSEVGYKWDKRNSTVANHFWDVRVYTLAIRDIFVESFLKSCKVKDISWWKYCDMIKKSLNT